MSARIMELATIIQHRHELKTVSVAESCLSLQANELSRLQQEVNPLSESDNYGSVCIIVLLSVYVHLVTLGDRDVAIQCG